jgi:hypothetical protein
MTTSSLACNLVAIETYWGIPKLGLPVDYKCFNALESTALINTVMGNGNRYTGIMHNDLSSVRVMYKGELKSVFSKIEDNYRKSSDYKKAKIVDKSKDWSIMVIDMPFTKKLRSEYAGYKFPEYLQNARLMVFISEGDKQLGYTYVNYLMYTPNP